MSTAGLFEGELVSGTGITAGTTIAQINSFSAISLSEPAKASQLSSLTFIGDDPVLFGQLDDTTSVTGLSSTGALYVGEPVTGAGIPSGTTITGIDSTTAITLSQAATAAGSAALKFIDNETVLAGTLNATTAVTGLASTAGLYLGEPVSGTGIPRGTTIARVNSPSAITLSQGATTSGPSILTFLSDFRALTARSTRRPW